MADICKCKGNGCPKKETCYRYTAKDSPVWQSYFTNEPLKDKECNYYWDNKKQKDEHRGVSH